MPKQVTSGALEFLNRALGLFGKGAQETFLEDGNVQLVLPVDNLASASQGIGIRQGMLLSNQRMTHAAAGDVIRTLDPYSPSTRSGETETLALPFRDDMWLLSLSAAVVSTTQTVDVIKAEMQGWPFDISAGATGTLPSSLLGYWDLVETPVVAGTFTWMQNSLTLQSLSTFKPFLWPRGVTLVSGSQTTGAGASSLDVRGTWALVPKGLRPSVW